ncbi:hypothetical protein OS493_008273 [Desmophyllum pertusum]|uniref:G-protein coupled receptors family 1 profile domain-containing protein n=1 Tax=Desmophyllum pertusum TaxID=174260 RepID=A0A9X0A4P9_9CNID|nr:hypothetical protein OS493_008273 [Desmophyllum pertusum]
MLLKALSYFVILLVSLIGNILVALVIYKNQEFRKSINYFVFNMAVSDLFTPLTIMPIKIVEIISGSVSWKVDSPWILGNMLCKLSYFLPDVSLAVSIGSLLLISMDRFIAVVFPLKVKLISSTLRLCSILCTWIIAIAVHAPYFYTFRLFTNTNESFCRSQWESAFDHHVETQKRYVTATSITFYLVPICLLAIMYGSIVWTLKTNNTQTKHKIYSQRTRRHQHNKNIMRMSVAIIITFLICIIPLVVFTFISLFLWNWEEPPICAFLTWIPFICLFMLHSWSALNPCICFVFSENYRNGLRQILPFSKRCFSRKTLEQANIPTETTSTTKRKSNSTWV